MLESHLGLDHGGVGGALHQLFGRGIQHLEKTNGLNCILCFVKMEGQKELTTMKKGSTEYKRLYNKL